MECFGTTDFDNNSRLITLSAAASTVFNDIRGKTVHDCSVILVLQRKKCINIVINAKPLIKTEYNGIAVNNFYEKIATVASEICR
jgi:uncharacterized membrane protein YhfC